MILLWRQGYTIINYLGNFNGEERGGNDIEGNDEGVKGDGGRGYEDNGSDGDDDDAKWQ
jgi:hypothetical protein